MKHLLKFIQASLCAAACTASADVVTNTWITAGGGAWLDKDADGVYMNWDGNITMSDDLMRNVAVFTLDEKAHIYSANNANVYPAGMCFRRPADVPDGEQMTWYLRSGQVGDKTYTDFSFSNAALGYFPLWVDAWASLVLGSDFAVTSENKLTVRKEGPGTVRVSNFFRQKNPDRRLEIAEGAVIPMLPNALAYTAVRVTDPAGALVLTNYSSKIMLGSYSSSAQAPVSLEGNDLQMGALEATVLPGEVTGSGRVSALVRTLYVTNVQPDIVYGARQGRLRLDSDNPAAVPFARYDFEESLTKDSSGHGRDLTSAGSVTRVYDEVRGGHVARFAATAKSGGKLSVEVPGTTELTGDTDYTISVWAKAVSPCANNWPTFVALGQKNVDHSLVQFRFRDSSCRELLLGHWNGRADLTGIYPPGTAAEWDSTAWHHYVAMRSGPRIRVWVDGTLCRDELDPGLEMTLAAPAKIHIGYLIGFEDRFFHGDLDDIRIYSRALGTDGVADLFAGREPVQDGNLPTLGAPLALPSTTRLALDLNGRIQLGGDLTLAAANIAASSPRGVLETAAGGSLTLTGGGGYGAGVAGAGAFVKDGDGTLSLSGTLDQTGGTRVKGGTLALQTPATQPKTFAVYDFEDSLGYDASGNGRTLTAGSGATRVWDAERGGYVARFDGTANPLQASITTDDLKGDTDYTLSVWAKADPSAPAKGSFLSVGNEQNFQEIVFRYQDAVSAGTLVLTHWGTTLDFTGIPSVANPAGAWHHFAATRRGTTYTVYCDGRSVWTTTKAQALAIPAKKTVAIGAQLNKTDRNFKGDLDDVRIYMQALGADDIARLAARGEPACVEPEEHVPAPVMHYAFENAQQAGYDSAPGANHLQKKGGGTFTFIDSPLGGKALKFDAYNQTYLKSASFPTALPADGKPFTVSFWALTPASDARNAPKGQNTLHTPTFVCWGDAAKGTIGYMLSYHHDPNFTHGWSTARCYVRKSGGGSIDKNSAEELLGLRDGEEVLRWHHYATVYNPSSGLVNYVDGQRIGNLCESGAFANDTTREGAFYLGAKSTLESAEFRGALDEVKVYDVALSERQVRLALRMEAGDLRVLPEGGDVAVDAGATLRVNGTRETVGALTGAGTVDLAAGTLAVMGETAFAGTLKGMGTLQLPAGASLALAQAPAGFMGYVELKGGALVLPEGTAKIPATFRVVPIDPSKTTACAGDVEIPDGTALTVSKGAAGPFVTSSGAVLVCGGGTVTLADAKASGTWTIGQGAENVRDLGEGDLNARWAVTNLPANRKAKFRVVDGAFTCTVLAGGTMLIVR